MKKFFITTLAIMTTGLMAFSACTPYEETAVAVESIAVEDIVVEDIAVEDIAVEDASVAEVVAAAEHSAFVSYWLDNLSVEEKIGQLIMPRLAWQSTIATQGIAHLGGIPFGGYILFTDNIDSIEQTQALVYDLQAASDLPLLISIDEEGGRVSRTGHLFGGATQSAFDIGQNSSPTTPFAEAQEIASRLNRLGVNTNFAPVADVWTNPENAVIGDRSFGHDAETVARSVSAMTSRMENSGIFATLKHFPGHGDTYEDSHYQLAFHNHDINRFWEVEAIPFMAGIEAGASMVMTGHISTPAVGGHTALLPWMAPWIADGRLPATFSDFWLQEVLRGQLGFEGVIITDGLEMRALTDHFTDGEIALGAFLAGADILLIPQDPVAAFEALLEGYHNGYFTRDRLVESVARVLSLKENL